MKVVAVLIITVCAMASASASCVPTLENGEHKWVTAKISDVGATTPGSNERQMKLTIQNWVVTAVPPDNAKFSKGDSVEMRQDGNTLSVRTKRDTLKCRLVCIQKVVFVE